MPVRMRAVRPVCGAGPRRPRHDSRSPRPGAGEGSRELFREADQALVAAFRLSGIGLSIWTGLTYLATRSVVFVAPSWSIRNSNLFWRSVPMPWADSFGRFQTCCLNGPHIFLRAL